MRTNRTDLSLLPIHSSIQGDAMYEDSSKAIAQPRQASAPDVYTASSRWRWPVAELEHGYQRISADLKFALAMYASIRQIEHRKTPLNAAER